MLGNVSVQAAETWQEKANPSDTEAVTCFPQGCRNREVRVGRIHTLESCSIHLSVSLASPYPVCSGAKYIPAKGGLLGPSAVQVEIGNFLPSRSRLRL